MMEMLRKVFALAAVIGLLDAAAKASGEIGKLPGDAVKEME